jgi:integrase/recombinase XerD
MNFEPYITGYLEYLTAKGYAAGTIKWRRVDLKQFLNYLTEKNILDLKAVTGSHIESYLFYLKKEYRTHRSGGGGPLAERTYYAHTTTITDFFDWLERTDQILITPLAGMPKPSKPRPGHLPIVLTEMETLKVLESCPINTPNGLRDRAILEVIYSTGIRRSELINLNVTDFLAERGELAIHQGKGRKDRIVPVGEYAIMFTLAYIKLVRVWQVPPEGAAALFLKNTGGERISSYTLGALINRAVKKSGVKKMVTPHTFRHSMATHLLRNKADLRHIQAILGHASLQSTEIYTHLTVEDLRQAVKKAHPHGKRKTEEVVSDSED